MSGSNEGRKKGSPGGPWARRRRRVQMQGRRRKYSPGRHGRKRPKTDDGLRWWERGGAGGAGMRPGRPGATVRPCQPLALGPGLAPGAGRSTWP